MKKYAHKYFVARNGYVLDDTYTIWIFRSRVCCGLQKKSVIAFTRNSFYAAANVAAVALLLRCADVTSINNHKHTHSRINRQPSRVIFLSRSFFIRL